MKTNEDVFSGVLLNGLSMLVFNFLFLIIICFGFYQIRQYQLSFILCFFIVLFVISLVAFLGFLKIEPNEARVMIFFGNYRGTIKKTGYFWVNPFYTVKRLTLRARNLDAEPIKVNDKNGNPILIGQVLVWKVVDTYKASFDIDNAMSQKVDNVNEKMRAYESFVKVQSDAALRFMAGMYAYDDSDNNRDTLTLRSGGEEMNEILEKQLNERLALAGIEVLEARINYLAYAPEIAAVMLRRQQADAIISAREKIVDGAVGMVKLALQKLSDDNIIELDDDKKAAMVTNLMVVLCSDEPAQPVINSGTLHH